MACLIDFNNRERNESQWLFNNRDVEGFMPEPGKHYVHVFAAKGRAFFNYLDAENDSHLILQLILNSKKLLSYPVPASCDPVFEQGFLYELHGIEKSDVWSSPLKLDLFVIECKSSIKKLLAAHSIDIRDLLVLENCSKSYSLELFEVYSHSANVGLLELMVSLIPSKTNALSENTLSSIKKMERSKWDEHLQLHLANMKTWHQQFLSISSKFHLRNICLIAIDEFGKKRDVCSFVTPLYTGRLIETPSHALWYVSLIPEENMNHQQAVNTICFSQNWCTIDAMLAKKIGNAIEHDILLCSILLSFKLKVFIFIGENHACEIKSGVISLCRKKGQIKIKFWDWKLGHVNCYEENVHGDLEIHCLFNDSQFYANTQSSVLVKSLDWDLNNESHWKILNREVIASYDILFTPAQLSAPKLDELALSNTIESNLKNQIIKYRKNEGLPTFFDLQLSYSLGVALAQYEIARKTGQTISYEDVGDCISNCIPSGHMFKAYPHHIIGPPPDDVLLLCSKFEEFVSILKCHKDQTFHGVRVRVYCYPEDVLSIWLIVACRCVQ